VRHHRFERCVAQLEPGPLLSVEPRHDLTDRRLEMADDDDVVGQRRAVTVPGFSMSMP